MTGRWRNQPCGSPVAAPPSPNTVNAAKRPASQPGLLPSCSTWSVADLPAQPTSPTVLAPARSTWNTSASRMALASSACSPHPSARGANTLLCAFRRLTHDSPCGSLRSRARGGRASDAAVASRTHVQPRARPTAWISGRSTAQSHRRPALYRPARPHLTRGLASLWFDVERRCPIGATSSPPCSLSRVPRGTPNASPDGARSLRALRPRLGRSDHLRPRHGHP